MKKNLHNLVFLLLSVSVLSAQVAKVGTFGSQFLKIPVGAQGMALGEGYINLVTGAEAAFSNPARLVTIDKMSAFASTTTWLGDMTYSAVAIGMSVGNKGKMVAFYSALNSGEMEETTIDDQMGTGNFFSSQYMQAGIGYAMPLTDKFSFGVNFKTIRENLVQGLEEDSNFGKSSSYAFDLATNYDTGFKSLRLTMVMRHFGTELVSGGFYNDFELADTIRVEKQIIDPNDDTNYITIMVAEEKEFSPYHLPMTFLFGVSYNILESKKQKLNLSTVVVQPSDNLQVFNLGVEYTVIEVFYARGSFVFGNYPKFKGYDDQGDSIYENDFFASDTRGLTGGFGFALPIAGFKTNIDFAYTQWALFNPTTNMSFSVRF
ncbi:MAG: PorV/PorQ family protein [Candidatus Marinimicrobia bacterium]|nr:PorV/PorQ family protein [Candidatus Neomarinimicrobiota bacterium]